MASTTKRSRRRFVVTHNHGEPIKMGRVENFVGWLTGRTLYWLATQAAQRNDWHEFNHVIAALMSGNSAHVKDPCPFPATACSQPLTFTGMTLTQDKGGAQ